jgi:hypothetical protein
VTQEFASEDGKNTIPTFDKSLLPLSTTHTFQAPIKEKRVRWHQNKHHWKYHNSFPVSFDPPQVTSEDLDISEVSALLNATTTFASYTLATLTPELSQ